MNSCLIRQVQLLDPADDRAEIRDVQIVDQAIDAIGVELPNPSKLEEIDGTGQVLGPGLIDLYSYSGEPGYEPRETLFELLQMAYQGGFTQVAVLPDTVPAADRPAQIRQRQQAGGPGQARCLPWGAISYDCQGKQLTDLTELSAVGVVGLCDGRPLMELSLLRRLLEYAQPLDLPIALWPCDRTQAGLCRNGADALRLGLAPIAAAAETIPLNTLLELLVETPRPVHVMRISTARGVERLRQAKAEGQQVTASVTWLHLVFTTENLDSYSPSLRLDPPLGNPADRDALVAGLEDGTLDAIAIDHRAYTYEEKAVPFGVAPPGALGLPVALSLLWQTFVQSGRWTPLQLWRYLSLQPARCLGIDPPALLNQQTGGMVLFDPQIPWQATPEAWGGRAANVPCLGWSLQGRVRQVWQAN